MKWCLVEYLEPLRVSSTLGALSTIFLFAWRIVLAMMREKNVAGPRALAETLGVRPESIRSGA